MKIEVWILAAKGQLETAFAVQVPMADTLIAAGFGEGGHDVVAKRDRLGSVTLRAARGDNKTCNDAGGDFEQA